MSKQHAAIEQRGGRVFLRDLGSTNGTLINGRHIRDLEVELHHDDQIQIGPVLSTVVIESAAGQTGMSVSMAGELVDYQGPDPASRRGPHRPPRSFLCSRTWTPRSRIKHEVLEDVLVVTPQLPELEDDATLEALRSTLPDPLRPTPSHAGSSSISSS